MSSLSSRAKLTLMADTDFVASSVVAGDATILDNITSIFPCTSSTRPAVPIEGQLIYETDTKILRRWSALANSWHLIGAGNSGLGLIGSFSDTSAHQVAGGSGSSPNYVYTSLLDYNFSIKPNWIYKIIEQGYFMETGTFNSSNTSLNLIELYSLYNIGSNPGLGSSGTALHYFRQDYNNLQLGGRCPYFKSMMFATPSSVAGNLFIRSALRFSNSSFLVAANQSFGRPADTIGSYAWVYSMGPSGVSY